MSVTTDPATQHNEKLESQAWTKKITFKAWLFLCAVVCGLVVLISWSIAKSYIQNHSLAQDEPDRVEKCRVRILGMLKPEKVDLNLLGNIHGLCYAEVNEEDVLLEFEIRRSAFLNQQAQIPIMLWMVVAITLSGVILAGMQLIAAYRLASVGRAVFEQGGQLSIQNNKISLSSSVTGLAILAISLAFFYVFVSEVYLIKEVGDAPGTSVAGTPDLTQSWGKITPQLEMKPGGLGSPIDRSAQVRSMNLNPSIKSPVKATPTPSGKQKK